MAAILAIGGLYIRIVQLQSRINGRMDELLTLAQRSAHAEGMLEAIPLVPLTSPTLPAEESPNTPRRSDPEPPDSS